MYEVTSNPKTEREQKILHVTTCRRKSIEQGKLVSALFASRTALYTRIRVCCMEII